MNTDYHPSYIIKGDCMEDNIVTRSLFADIYSLTCLVVMTRDIVEDMETTMWISPIATDTYAGSAGLLSHIFSGHRSLSIQIVVETSREYFIPCED